MWERIKAWWKPSPEQEQTLPVQEQAPVSVPDEPKAEPSPVQVCPKCRASVTCWRTYADGSVCCVPCDSKRKRAQ